MSAARSSASSSRSTPAAHDAAAPAVLPGAAVGGAFDAGHYRSVGSAKHLEFDPRNVHGQCKRCNQYLGGDPVRYRIGLIARIGLAEVEALECDEMPRKLTRDQVREIRDHYRAAAAMLKKAPQGSGRRPPRPIGRGRRDRRGRRRRAGRRQ